MDKPLNIKGTGKLYEDNSFEFVPQKEGNPQRKDVVRTANATHYTTTGKTPKKVVTIQYNPDVPDPQAVVLDEVEKIFGKICPEKSKKDEKPRGRVLLKEACTEVRYNEKEKRIEASFYVPLTLHDGKDFKTNFYETLQTLSKCLAYNTDFLTKRLTAINKDSSK
jgi:hypothetical protein